MNADRQQFSLALGLSAGANLLLFLAIAWSMAVTEGLTGGKSRRLNPLTAPSLPAPPDVISLTLAPEPEPTKGPERQMILSPGDQPDTAPSDPATRFISSTNMKAASEEAASPDGIAGLATQQGLDKPFLDLRDSEFRDGGQPADRPPEPTPPPAETPPAPPIPPTPSDQSDQPAQSAPPSEPQDTPPEKDTPPPAPADAPTEKAVPAFRDNNSPNLIPVPEKPVPEFRRASPPPPPLTRIPDRVPRSQYAPGTRKSKQLGTISNKGSTSVDATATEEGRFGKHIRTAIEKGWRRRMLSLSSLANPGLVEVEFEVDPKGRISNVKLANPGEANPVMQDCALSAVIEAKLPPPPRELFEELQDNLTGGRMRCSFSFLIY